MDINLLDLLLITSGATNLLIGNKDSEADQYWPTASDNNWRWQGTVVQFFESDLPQTLGGYKVGFISTLVEDGETYMRVLIK